MLAGAARRRLARRGRPVGGLAGTLHSLIPVHDGRLLRQLLLLVVDLVHLALQLSRRQILLHLVLR